MVRLESQADHVKIFNLWVEKQNPNPNSNVGGGDGNPNLENPNGVRGDGGNPNPEDLNEMGQIREAIRRMGERIDNQIAQLMLMITGVARRLPLPNPERQPQGDGNPQNLETATILAKITSWSNQWREMRGSRQPVLTSTNCAYSRMPNCQRS